MPSGESEAIDQVMKQVKPPSPTGLFVTSTAFAFGSGLQVVVLWVRLHFTQNRDAIWVHGACALTFAAAAWAFFHAGRKIRAKRQRLASGACLHCGYLLTGNVTGVCPECGTPTTAGVKA